MFSLFKRRPDPETVVIKLCKTIPEDLMKVLDNFDPIKGFELRLLSLCCLRERTFKFKFKTWEEAQPKVEKIIRFGINTCKDPISKDVFENFCIYIMIHLFYEV